MNILVGMPPVPDEITTLDHLISNQLEELITARKHLHKHPELSGNEYKTQEFIIQYLKDLSSAQLKKIGGTGVLVSFENSSQENILIRVDIDALPIQEINDFDHRSVIKGCSHKCGHDGHTVIGLGLCHILHEKPIESLNVHVLFQPAEENGKGAEAVIKDELFSDLNFDMVFALHNLPGFKQDQIAVKEDSFTPAVRSLILKMQGKTAHAAEPEKGTNPSLALAQLMQLAQEFTVNEPESDDFFLAGCIYAELGEKAYGISAGEAELHLTFRAWTSELMINKSMDYLLRAQEICEEFGLKTNYEWLEEFHANQNHPDAVSVIKAAAVRNELTVKQLVRPFRWGEDFGLFTQKFKGAMFGIGAGKNIPALHNPDYDFPDEIITTGIKMFYRIIQSYKTI